MIAIGAAAVGVAIILGVFLLYQEADQASQAQIPATISEKTDMQETKLEQQSAKLPFSEAENPVIAEVNGEMIHLQELKEVQTTIHAQTGQDIQSDVLLDQLVTRTVLLQEAEDRDISVTRQEAESFLEQQISQSEMTVDQFKERLESQGADYENTVEIYQAQMTVDELLSEELSSNNLSVSDTEAKLFFDQNLDAIKSQLGDDVVYEDITDLIKNTILQQKQQDVVTKFVNQLKSDSEITTYKELL